MRGRAVAVGVALTLLGLAIAVAVGIAAANLFSSQIGIAEQPVRAGEELAPRVAPPPFERPVQSGDD